MIIDMLEPVRFVRTHNRTAVDVFKNMIMPKLPLVLNIVCQQITYYCRQNHAWKNRTGALEKSITWTPAESEGAIVRAAIIAGGPSQAQFEYVARIVFYYDEQGRLRRFEPKEPRVINKGQSIWVDYAVFVERKGYPVLKQGIEYYRPKLAAQLAARLRTENLPRFYTYKYTGQTQDIYGNG